MYNHIPTPSFLGLPQEVRARILRAAGLVRTCPISLNHERQRLFDRRFEDPDLRTLLEVTRRFRQRFVRNPCDERFDAVSWIHPAVPTAVLRVNRQLRDEASAIFYGENRFFMEGSASTVINVFRKLSRRLIEDLTFLHISFSDPSNLEDQGRSPWKCNDISFESLIKAWTLLCRWLSTCRLDGLRLSCECNAEDYGVAAGICQSIKLLSNLKELRVNFCSRIGPYIQLYWRLGDGWITLDPRSSEPGDLETDLGHRMARLSTDETIRVQRMLDGLSRCIKNPTSSLLSSRFSQLPRELLSMILHESLVRRNRPPSQPYAQAFPLLRPLRAKHGMPLLRGDLARGRWCCGNCGTIFRTCCCNHGATWSSTCTCDKPPMALFEINKEIRAEALAIYYSKNRFEIRGATPEDVQSKMALILSHDLPLMALVTELCIVIEDTIQISAAAVELDGMFVKLQRFFGHPKLDLEIRILFSRPLAEITSEIVEMDEFYEEAEYLQNNYGARKDADPPVNLDFDARVPISFSVFPSSYRSDTAVGTDTKVTVEGEADLTSRVGREGIDTRYSSYQSTRPRQGQQDIRQETRIYQERDGRRGRDNVDIDVDIEVERDRYQRPYRRYADAQLNIDEQIYDRDFNTVDRRGGRFDTDIDIDIRERGPAYGPTLERERLTVDDRRRTHDMGYYDEDGHYHSFRHGAHKAADRVLHPFDHTYYERHHGGRHHGGRDEVDVDVDINVGGTGGPRRSRDYDVREVDYEVRGGANYVSDNVRYIDRTLPPNTITIPCHHIRVGDIVILQGRPCQVIRITTSASTGQHRYLGVDLFNKQMYEESSFSSNPSPSVYVQNMLGPVFKQYRVLDIRPDGRVVAMTETGGIKQGLPVLDQGSLFDRLQDAFANGRGSVRVLVIKDSARELAVDYKVVSGSRL